ncbi:MAG: hypothetical protein AAFR89_00350, partial [Cyanobacteria bacterium J06633_1]
DAANPAGGKVNSGYDNLSGNALGGITAINNIQWNGSEASGAFLQVSGPKQREGAAPIVVQVADLLFERADGLDLSAEAFAQVADPVDGVVNIEYELIGPGMISPRLTATLSVKVSLLKAFLNLIPTTALCDSTIIAIQSRVLIY